MTELRLLQFCQIGALPLNCCLVSKGCGVQVMSEIPRKARTAVSVASGSEETGARGTAPAEPNFENELFPPLLAECGHCRPARSAGQASARPGLAGVGARAHSWPSARAASATPPKLSFRDSRRNLIHLSDDLKRETSFGA